jgi:hypothetical protein
VLLFFSHGAIVILALVLLLILHWCYCSSCVVLLFFSYCCRFSHMVLLFFLRDEVSN